MATVNLDTIMRLGLIAAFILPILAIVSATLPAPSVQPGGVNVSANLTSTGQQIYSLISHTYINTSQTLLGACGAPTPSGIPYGNTSTSGGKNCSSGSSGLYANPTIFQAFAFILNNLATVITDIVQLPYLDYLSLQLLVWGMSTVVPFVPLSFLSVGVNLLYLYMGFSLLMMSVGLIQKYNPKVG